MTNRWGNSGNSDRLFFLGSKIIADGDCSHEIKRRLLLGRKVMTNIVKVKVKMLSHIRLLATPWTPAYQAPPSMGFSRQEYWSGVPLVKEESEKVDLKLNIQKTKIMASGPITS